jgi:hypothetical protein
MVLEVDLDVYPADHRAIGPEVTTNIKEAVVIALLAHF